MTTRNETIQKVLDTDQDQLLDEWLAEALAGAKLPGSKAELAQSARTLLKAVRAGVGADGETTSLDGPAWASVRDALSALSASRAAQGVSAGDTSVFISAMKKPLFARLQEHGMLKPEEAIAVLWRVSSLVDKMAQYAVTTYQARAKTSSSASRKSCWSCPRPWSSCGTACWRCR